jgi:acetolactate synthase-1/2/3 large subunit
MSETITGAQSLVYSLEAAGVTDVFGIPGGAILPLYDPLMDSQKVGSACAWRPAGRGPRTS